MTLTFIINSILVLILPFLVMFCVVLAQFYMQRLPMHQRVALEQFSRMSVRYVEQLHLHSPDKKALATAYTSDMFKLFGLPTPHEDVLEVAIVAAMYEITHG